MNMHLNLSMQIYMYFYLAIVVLRKTPPLMFLLIAYQTLMIYLCLKEVLLGQAFMMKCGK